MYVSDLLISCFCLALLAAKRILTGSVTIVMANAVHVFFSSLQSSVKVYCAAVAHQLPAGKDKESPDPGSNQASQPTFLWMTLHAVVTSNVL